jgi:hypothetical protein
MTTRLSRNTRRAIAKYGEEGCRRAFQLSEEGWGAATIAAVGTNIPESIRTTQQADAAIHAGRELAGLPPFVRPEQLERARDFWADTAKRRGWYAEPFYVQVWVDAKGNVTDSVAVRGQPQDWVVRDTY